jgi:hypothetical protein
VHGIRQRFVNFKRMLHLVVTLLHKVFEIREKVGGKTVTIFASKFSCLSSI